MLTYIFYGKTSAELNRLYEIQNQNDRIASDEAYYKILDMQNKQLKSIIHDEKNHLSDIKSLAENPEVSEYIDELYDNIIENSLFGNTNNKILNLIINKNQYICNAEGIDFYVSIKTSNLSDIEKTDLISLLGNLLDNAVDAAKNSENKKIDLSLNKVNGFDLLTCSNSCAAPPETVGGDLKSTKGTSDFHGIGVKNIKKVVKKYKGTFEWLYDRDKKEFNVYITF